MRVRGIFVAAALAAFAGVAFTQDKDAMEAGMKRWMDSCKAGPNHKQLARLVGSWDTEVSVLGMGAPMKEKGTAEIRWLAEGKWIVNDAKGAFMGMPVASHTVLGYDNFKKKFVASHCDSMATHLLTAQGLMDQSGNALIMFGTMDEPMTGECEKTVKWIWRFDGPDTFRLEIHDMDIGETNTKVMEFVYTRRK